MFCLHLKKYIHENHMFLLVQRSVFHHYEEQVQVLITYTRQTDVQLNRLLVMGKTIPWFSLWRQETWPCDQCMDVFSGDFSQVIFRHVMRHIFSNCKTYINVLRGQMNIIFMFRTKVEAGALKDFHMKLHILVQQRTCILPFWNIF